MIHIFLTQALGPCESCDRKLSVYRLVTSFRSPAGHYHAHGSNLCEDCLGAYPGTLGLVVNTRRDGIGAVHATSGVAALPPLEQGPTGGGDSELPGDPA